MVSSLLSALNAILRHTLNDVVCFQLLPVNAAYTMGINHGEETASRMEYDGSGYTPADCTNSAQIMDNGYTISVKTEDERPETLQYGRPIHWTVDNRGVLVNADESEVTVKGEKPDWTTETEIADCSTIIAGQGGTQDAVLFDFV